MCWEKSWYICRNKSWVWKIHELIEMTIGRACGIEEFMKIVGTTPTKFRRRKTRRLMNHFNLFWNCPAKQKQCSKEYLITFELFICLNFSSVIYFLCSFRFLFNFNCLCVCFYLSVCVCPLSLCLCVGMCMYTVPEKSWIGYYSPRREGCELSWGARSWTWVLWKSNKVLFTIELTFELPVFMLSFNLSAS